MLAFGQGLFKAMAKNMDARLRELALSVQSKPGHGIMKVCAQLFYHHCTAAATLKLPSIFEREFVMTMNDD